MKSHIDIKCVNPRFTQTWTSDPDMVLITLTLEIFLLAEKAISQMRTLGIDEVVKWYALPNELYAESDYCDDGTGLYEGKYVVFEPEYRVDGCHLKMLQNGTLTFVIPFKHSNEELFSDIGNISDLRQLFEEDETNE